MSGKPKSGFDWAKWDTHFDDDEKIDELLDAQGWSGFGVYFWLCQKAYANGYYYRWSYANAATTARKMGGGIRSETVKATVGTCCQVGLFDKRLLEREGILTSRRIQRTYVDAVSKGNRSYRTVDKRYWLLGQSETSAGKIEFFETEIPDVGDSYAEKNDFLIENADVLIEHSPKKRTEQNRSLERERARAKDNADFEVFWNAYPRKTAITEAFKAWIAVSDARPPVEEMIAAVERQKASDQWTEAGGKYIPSPARWLRQYGWINEEPEVQPGTAQRGNKKSSTFWDVAEQMKEDGEV